MVTIKNEYLTARIAERGAELKSLSRDGIEFMYEGRPEVWDYSAPMVFPICGALKDGKFTYRGKEYSLMKHGFARTAVFSAEKLSESSAVFTLAPTEEMKSSYPFDFELRVIFSLVGERLSVKYEVENKGNGTMYFSIGSHEAYRTEGGIERFDVVFDEPITVLKTAIEDGLTGKKTVPVLKNSAVYPLYESVFINDALVFRDFPTRAATLRDRVTGRGVRVEFPDMKNMLLWHVPGAPYMCIEPWSGMPDAHDADGLIEHKLDITALEAGKTYENEHFIIPIL